MVSQDNIWPRYNYLKIWNLRVHTPPPKKKTKQKKQKNNAFKVVQMQFLAIYSILLINK